MTQDVCDKCGEPTGKERMNVTVWANTTDSTDNASAARIVGGYRFCSSCWDYISSAWKPVE